MTDNSFLRSLALHLHNNYGNELNDMVLVFPNRRAGLFFRKHLALTRRHVSLAPQVMTINDLFDSLSQYPLNTDRIDLIMILHEVYCQVAKREISLDDFMFWGQMMLNDFDEIDDHLVDAKHLFIETSNIKHLDATFAPDLSEEQKKAITALFGAENVIDDSMKGRFSAMWDNLAATHESFAERLIAGGSGIYKGLQHRLVIKQLTEDSATADNLWNNTFGGKRLVFIGFNALTSSEERLLSFAKEHDADFYWDYGSPDLRNLRGSLYEHNTSCFPSRIPLHVEQEPLLSDFNSTKSIRLYSISSDIAQAKIAAYLLSQQLPDGDEPANQIFEDTAVVLPNEQLLLPLLDSLDSRIEHINVTMGYPLASTPVYALLDYLCQLQLKRRVSGEKTVFYHKDVESVLCHSYVRHWEQAVNPEVTAMQVYEKQIKQHRIYAQESDLQQNDLLKLLFRVVDQDGLIAYLKDVCEFLLSAENVAQSESENLNDEQIFLSQAVDMLDRLHVKFGNKSPLEMIGLVRLIKQLSATETVSFRGEPLHGLQIMGALEARALDFSNLTILSVNEGVFPKPSSNNTFLPYNVRKAYLLPTHELADSVESYNFYRMLLHARNVNLVYDIRQDGDQRGEVSRFVMQLRYKYGVHVEEIQVQTHNAGSNIASQPLIVQKAPHVMQQLTDKLFDEKRGISASAIKNYLRCTLKFYLDSVEYIQAEDRLNDEIQDNEFGNVVHSSLEAIYNKISKKTPNNYITPSVLDALLTDKSVVHGFVETAFREQYMKNDAPIAGQEQMVFDVAERYVRCVLEADKVHAPFYFLGAEYKFRAPYLSLPDGRVVVLNGSIDRIDLKQEDSGYVLRVIDYKTGSPHQNITCIGDMFSREKSDCYNAMQACMYCLVMEQMLNNPDAKFYNEVSIRDITSGNSITIEPHLLYVRSLVDDEDYSSNIFVKPDRYAEATKLVWSPEVSQQYTALLAETFSEMLDCEVPFAQVEAKNQCLYCQFGDSCNRETTPSKKK